MHQVQRKYRIIVVEILTLILLTLFIFFFDLDIKIQKIFYKADASSVWFQKESALWQAGYHYGTLPAILLTGGALLGLILSWTKSTIKYFRRYFLLIILTLIIGPGLLVNAIFKDHWGRPRPRQVQEFGGRWEYKDVWQPGKPGKGKSFPCGHCSMGFFFITLYYCFKQKHKALAYSSFAFSIALGAFIGFARISQGGHFLSDVLWSWGFTYLTAGILYYYILKIPDFESGKKRDVAASSKVSIKKTVLAAIAAVFCISIMIFTFLFSKPFYKESMHNVRIIDKIRFVKLQLDISRGKVVFHRGNFEYPVQIKTVAQGFGFPKYKYQSKLSNKLISDTLVAHYILSLEGLFNELDVQSSIYVDTTRVAFNNSSINKDVLILDNKNSAITFIKNKN